MKLAWIQDIGAIGKICGGSSKIFVSRYACPSTGKVPIDLQELNVDLMSFCAAQNLRSKRHRCIICISASHRVRIEAQNTRRWS